MFRFTTRDLLWWTVCTSLVLGRGGRGDGRARHGLRLRLTSGYSRDGLLGPNNPSSRTLELKLQLDSRGGGSGTLTVNSNYVTYDEFGKVRLTTLLHCGPRPVMLQQIVGSCLDPDDGSCSFEISGHGQKGRLFLVVPRYRTSCCRLVCAGPSQDKHVIVLDSTDR